MSFWKRYRYEILLAALFVVVVSPVLQIAEADHKLLAAVFLTLLTLAALNAVSAGRAMRRLITVAAIVAFLAGFADLYEPSAVLSHVQDGSAALFFGLVAALILRDVVAPGQITAERIVAAVCVYFVFAMLYSAIYSMIYTADPAAFRGIEGDLNFHTATYFSLVTLTTLGYGDIIPVSPLARSLAVLEAATGVLYLATLVARLVALQIAHSALGRDEDEPDQNASS